MIEKVATGVLSGVVKVSGFLTGSVEESGNWGVQGRFEKKGG